MNDATPSAIQPEATSPETESAFVCDCEEWMRSACQGEPFFHEHEGKRYCVLHYPDADKVEAFRVAFNRKLEAKDYDFGGVWFPEGINFQKFEFSTYANFTRAMFSAGVVFENVTFCAPVSFIEATFSEDAIFVQTTFSAGGSFSNAAFSATANFTIAMFGGDANFSFATFRGSAYFYATFGSFASFAGTTFGADAYFNPAKFSADADFSNTTFSADANFLSATFSANADFRNAKFSANAEFSSATFSAYANFSSAMLKNYVNFAGKNKQRNLGEQAGLVFQFAHIEKPDRVSFHTLDLKPHWFINCDCRKFEFVNCEWNHNLKQELEGATKAEISAPHRLLAITLRQLADNAEANHHYPEASKFRYNAFEAQRIVKLPGLATPLLYWLYRQASGYGESVERAFVVLIALFALFAFGYGQVGFDQGSKVAPASASQPDTVGKPLGWKEAFVYSFNVSILQKPEPKPLTLMAKTLVSLETVLGPAQAALLALAVRRRFMR